ncbi:MAG: ACP synthase, partial [Eggerthellaceae bacterium]|nr:ACP synthase [Eggerthellaceae bacterium]
CGLEDGVWLHDIEVKRSSKGRPYVAITVKLRQVAREMDINDIPISLSYTHSEAIACAMAITSASEPEQKRPDPKEELSEQFKKTRAILDDL